MLIRRCQSGNIYVSLLLIVRTFFPFRGKAHRSFLSNYREEPSSVINRVQLEDARVSAGERD